MTPDYITDYELECLEECIQAHVHGFYTCAEVGIAPDLNSFILNVCETAEEYEQHPSLSVARRYITEHWGVISQSMTDPT